MATSCRDVTFFLILGALALALASLGGPENVGWTSYADKTTDVEGSFAHRAYVVTGVEGSADVYDREFHYDDSDTCGIDFCDKCHTAGRASMAIIILTAIINVGALVLAYLRMESGTAGRVRVASVICTVGYLVGTLAWLSCHFAIDDDLGSVADIKVSVGFALGVVAVVLQLAAIGTTCSWSAPTVEYDTKVESIPMQHVPISGYHHAPSQGHDLGSEYPAHSSPQQTARRATETTLKDASCATRSAQVFVWVMSLIDIGYEFYVLTLLLSVYTSGDGVYTLDESPITKAFSGKPCGEQIVYPVDVPKEFFEDNEMLGLIYVADAGQVNCNDAPEFFIIYKGLDWLIVLSIVIGYLAVGLRQRFESGSSRWLLWPLSPPGHSCDEAKINVSRLYLTEMIVVLAEDVPSIWLSIAVVSQVSDIFSWATLIFTTVKALVTTSKALRKTCC